MIETLTFRLGPGVDETAFREADRRVQTEFIPNHPGFARRTTARGSDGEWLVVTLWSSTEAADASAQLATTDPIVAAFTALIEDAVVRRYQTLD